MTLVQGLLNGVQRMTCRHQWVRARWRDGSYGLRCAHCMKAYAHTWNEIVNAPVPGDAPMPPAAAGLQSELDGGLRAA